MTIYTTSKASMEVWHQRLGHVSKQHVKESVVATDGAVITEGDDFNCKACLVARSKKVILRTLQQRSKQAFEMVHFDIMDCRNLPDYKQYRCGCWSSRTISHAIGGQPPSPPRAKLAIRCGASISTYITLRAAVSQRRVPMMIRPIGVQNSRLTYKSNGIRFQPSTEYCQE